ncbi:hypothetical protein ACFQJ5_04875 [Halomicroarcula sp. GCM10025324]|uniref:hypothetical protein n=1 Tax=Haloarcula TaxID=2237 RepID=UPI0023E8BC1F|nr:hypothetical protein [Halomicroarcula sp. ZS-22-S1]
MLPASRCRSLVLPDGIQRAIAESIEASHPDEAGGYLACDRRGNRLFAVDHVPLENESETPRTRFVSTAASVPDRPRVFYHSHTSSSSQSGLTSVDRSNIPDRYALVVFAPHGEPFSYRFFRRGVFNWREVPVRAPVDGQLDEMERLPRLI